MHQYAFNLALSRWCLRALSFASLVLLERCGPFPYRQEDIRAEVIRRDRAARLRAQLLRKQRCLPVLSDLDKEQLCALYEQGEISQEVLASAYVGGVR